MIWFGLLCIGCAPALINYNLEGKGLVHCLDVCQAKLIIVDEDEECRKRIDGSRKEIEEDRGMKTVQLDDVLRRTVSVLNANVPGDEYRKDVKPDFPNSLIYTRYSPPHST